MAVNRIAGIEFNVAASCAVRSYREKLMDQPVPDVSENDVVRVVRRDFSPQQFGTVMAILNEYGTEEWQRECHRVRLAALKLAKGNLAAVRRQIDIAKLDYRDVLAPAEYPDYMGMVPPSGKTDESDRRKIILSDWDQYQAWLKKE